MEGSCGIRIGVAVQEDLPLALSFLLGYDLGIQDTGICHYQQPQIKGGNLHIVEHYKKGSSPRCSCIIYWLRGVLVCT